MHYFLSQSYPKQELILSWLLVFFSRVRQFALQFSTGSRDISFALIGQCENECFDFTTPSQNAHG